MGTALPVCLPEFIHSSKSEEWRVSARYRAKTRYQEGHQNTADAAVAVLGLKMLVKVAPKNRTDSSIQRQSGQRTSGTGLPGLELSFYSWLPEPFFGSYFLFAYLSFPIYTMAIILVHSIVRAHWGKMGKALRRVICMSSLQVFFFLNIYLFIYSAVPGLSCSMRDLYLWYVGSSSLTKDRTWSPGTWTMESHPLNHQGSTHPSLIS